MWCVVMPCDSHVIVMWCVVMSGEQNLDKELVARACSQGSDNTTHLGHWGLAPCFSVCLGPYCVATCCCTTSPCMARCRCYSLRNSIQKVCYFSSQLTTYSLVFTWCHMTSNNINFTTSFSVIGGKKVTECVLTHSLFALKQRKYDSLSSCSLRVCSWDDLPFTRGHCSWSTELECNGR